MNTKFDLGLPKTKQVGLEHAKKTALHCKTKVEDYLDQFGDMSYLEPFEAISGYWVQFGDIWKYLEPFATIWCILESFGVFLSHLKPC